jgi:hypothetical protein
VAVAIREEEGSPTTGSSEIYKRTGGTDREIVRETAREREREREEVGKTARSV